MSCACITLPEREQGSELSVFDRRTGYVLFTTGDLSLRPHARTASYLYLEHYGELLVGDANANRSFCQVNDFSGGGFASLAIYRTTSCAPIERDGVLCFQMQQLERTDDGPRPVIVIDGCARLHETPSMLENDAEVRVNES